MSTEGDFIPDTYRTPGPQAEPPEPSVCYDCKHARYALKDGHAEMSISRDDVIRKTHLLRCADGEERSADAKCFTSGNVRKGVAIEREWCNSKNPNGECAKFVRHIEKPAAIPGIELVVKAIAKRRPVPWTPIAICLSPFLGLALWAIFI